jgi:hypothetical protein
LKAAARTTRLDWRAEATGWLMRHRAMAGRPKVEELLAMHAMLND